MYTTDNRIVMTLDAGGTNFVFSAIKGYKFHFIATFFDATIVEN